MTNTKLIQVMDYEKAYNEALERARQIKDGKDEWRYSDLAEITPALTAIFPELRESEDERIRKELIFFLKKEIPQCSIKEHADKLKEFVSWLEKQKEPENTSASTMAPSCWEVERKEQKPAEWSEVELEFRGEKVKVKRPFYRDDKGRGYSTAKLDEEVAWNALRAWCEKKGISLYDLYPKAEWGEEDEKMLNEVLNRVTYAFYDQGNEGEIEDDPAFLWLHRLRPSWKPSEEHLSALLAVFNDPDNIGSQTCQLALTDLYEQLKKL